MPTLLPIGSRILSHKLWPVCPVLLSLAGCGTSIAAWTDTGGIAGFEKLRWGMTAKQIQDSYPAFRYEKLASLPINGLILHNYVLAGCQFTVSLTFFDNGADSLTTIGFDYVGGDFVSCRDRIKAMLLQQYGDNPTQAIPKRANEVTYTNWRGPILSVQLREYQQPSGNPALEIEYTHTGAPGTYVE